MGGKRTEREQPSDRIGLEVGDGIVQRGRAVGVFVDGGGAAAEKEPVAWVGGWMKSRADRWMSGWEIDLGGWVGK